MKKKSIRKYTHKKRTQKKTIRKQKGGDFETIRRQLETLGYITDGKAWERDYGDFDYATKTGIIMTDPNIETLEFGLPETYATPKEIQDKYRPFLNPSGLETGLEKISEELLKKKLCIEKGKPCFYSTKYICDLSIKPGEDRCNNTVYETGMTILSPRTGKIYIIGLFRCEMKITEPSIKTSFRIDRESTLYVEIFPIDDLKISKEIYQLEKHSINNSKNLFGDEYIQIEEVPGSFNTLYNYYLNNVTKTTFHNIYDILENLFYTFFFGKNLKPSSFARKSAVKRVQTAKTSAAPPPGAAATTPGAATTTPGAATTPEKLATPPPGEAATPAVTPRPIPRPRPRPTPDATTSDASNVVPDAQAPRPTPAPRPRPTPAPRPAHTRTPKAPANASTTHTSNN